MTKQTLEFYYDREGAVICRNQRGLEFYLQGAPNAVSQVERAARPAFTAAAESRRGTLRLQPGRSAAGRAR